MKTISGTLQTEIAKELGITRQAVNFMAHRDRWRIVVKIGRTCVYETADVMRTINSRSGKKRGTHTA